MKILQLDKKTVFSWSAFIVLDITKLKRKRVTMTFGSLSWGHDEDANFPPKNKQLFIEQTISPDLRRE